MVTTYNPHDNTLVNLVKQNWGILGKSTNTRFIYDHKLLTAYRRPSNLRDLLVKADCQVKKQTLVSPTNERDNATTFLRSQNLATPGTKSTQQLITKFLKRGNPLHQEITSSSSTSDLNTSSRRPFRTNSLQSLGKTKLRNVCKNSKCRYCPKIDKSGSIKCTVTGIEYPCKSNITCKSSNLIYAITCRSCLQQYVGQTKRSLANRFQGHFYNTTSAIGQLLGNNTSQQRIDPKDGVSSHFSRPDHNGTQDMSIRVLDFIRLPPNSEKALSLRLKIEKTWIHKLRCIAPTGLNIFD